MGLEFAGVSQGVAVGMSGTKGEKNASGVKKERKDGKMEGWPWPFGSGIFPAFQFVFGVIFVASIEL